MSYSLIKPLRGAINKVFGKARPTHRLGIELRADGIAWAVAMVDADKILATGFEPCTPAKRVAGLQAILEAQHLRTAAVCVSLLPDQYQSHPVEKPKVPDAEMTEAVRWKLKDLVDYDIADAIVDVFEFPADAARNRGPLINGVSARKALLKEVVGMVSAAGLSLEKIDIAELGLRNIAARMDPESRGFAMLYLREGHGLFVLGKGNTLYLARRVNFSLSMLEDAGRQDEVVQSLALEVQRSLDYFESQLGQAPPRRLSLVAADEQHPLPQMLSPYLALPVEILAWQALLGLDDLGPAGESLIAAGVLLSPQEEDAA